MREVNINRLVRNNILIEKNIPNDIIIVGRIITLHIDHKYDQLDLSRITCNKIYYQNQKGESIKNHILPDSLEKLYCDNNRLTSLPNLPNLLKELDCSYNRLTSFDYTQLPNSLKYLGCSNNKLTSLPDLPDSLKYLYCYENKLTKLLKLPNSLIELNCSKNQLTLLPNLPNSLIRLNCSKNLLILLPNLPNSLQKLYCGNNKLTSLPNLSNSLEELYCSNNQLTSLPNLNMLTSFHGDNEVDYIDYDLNYEGTKIIFSLYYNGNEWVNSYIEIKDYGKITSKEEYIQYMEKIKLSKIKSARK